MHEWMADNGYTPHLVVDARRKGVHVPEQHIQDGKIILNVSHSATRGLSLGNDVVSFEARFGGASQRLEIPVEAVLGIYARETGQGMIFGDDDSQPPAGPPTDPQPASTDPNAAGGSNRPGPRKSAKLKVVK
jgi:stringent starvation protein B